MGKVAYLFNDYIKDLAGASIALTSEDTKYPTENSQNEQVALCTRTTAKVAIKYQITLASAKALQMFFIGNHNFSGGTFDINSYTANDFSTGKTVVEANKAIRLLDCYHRETSAPDARKYWEFDFTNATSAKTYFEFGRIMVYDDLVQFTEVEDFEKERSLGFRNIINVTPYGVRHVHKMTDKREGFELEWRVRTQATILPELRTLFEAIDGDAHPFVLIPDLAATGCYYGYSEEDELKYKEAFGTESTDFVADLKLSFIEAVRGKA